MRSLVLLCLMLVASFSPSQAAEKIKIGFLTTLSGPAGVYGAHMRDAMRLAIEHLGGKIGGLETEVVVEDDQLKPDVARQIVDKFLKSDRVDVVAGVPNSAVMLAIFGPVTKNKTVLISANAGPSQIAGAGCSEYFFSASWQGDNYSEALGAYLQSKNVQNLFVMAPNYAAGKDVVAGLKRFYKNSIVDEIYTPLSQLDFSAELAQIRAAKPSAVFAFYPGGLGVQFAKQYSQAGLKDTIPLYTSFVVDNTTLPAIGNDALGMITTTFWNDDMDNPENKRFVRDFTAKYGYPPSNYAAQAYDAMMLLDSGVRGVGGKIEDKPKFLAELAKANFKSVRGDFKFNNNHFPIQDFYLATVVKGDDGKPRLKIGEQVMKDHGDAYASQCALKK